LYEPPYNDDPEAQQAWAVYLDQLASALAAGRRGDAVALFMTYAGAPVEQVAAMRDMPFWTDMEQIAPTLIYDHAAILGRTARIPIERVSQIGVPTQVMYGTDSHAFMAETARTLSREIPGARLYAFEHQGHDVDPARLAAVLLASFAR
jgi:pimeloyl-ACP methyl ester carboxylesterase